MPTASTSLSATGIDTRITAAVVAGYILSTRSR